MRIRLALATCCLLIGLLPGPALSAEPEERAIAGTLMDAQRCLLLFAATGDEHFLGLLPRLTDRLDKQLADQPGANAMPLWNLWLLHQQAVASARAHYAPGGPQLQAALRQAESVVAQLPTYLPQVQAGTTPELSDDLRELALLEAQNANQKLLEGDANKRREQIARLQRNIDLQLSARPASAETESLRTRWRYLRLTERENGTLLYPFNAQLEYLLTRLSD